ncbi:hypothetical protein CB1_000598019 [Camelus ferus]|nr:hypothetical protein CB1_000598019 [Camelus ferus]
MPQPTAYKLRQTSSDLAVSSTRLKLHEGSAAPASFRLRHVGRYTPSSEKCHLTAVPHINSGSDAHRPALGKYAVSPEMRTDVGLEPLAELIALIPAFGIL